MAYGSNETDFRKAGAMSYRPFAIRSWELA